MDSSLDELIRDVDKAIEQAREIAGSLGMPRRKADTLVRVMRDVARTAARSGYERGWADAQRAGGGAPTPPLTGRSGSG